MSDESVALAIRSSVSLVVVESPAGCGKTYQAAEYARELAPQILPGRALILTHTHAACDEIAARTAGSGRVEIRTLDSLVVSIGSAYHLALGLPPDAAQWARGRKEGYQELARKVGKLLAGSSIAVALARRYPVVILDEHQDSSAEQHAIVLALQAGGAALRVFGDPMQQIYERTEKDAIAAAQRWGELAKKADKFEKLDTPHRWAAGPARFGDWILAARETLKAGGRVDLRGALPAGLTVLRANSTARRYGAFDVSKADRAEIERFVAASPELLVLTRAHLVRGMHTFFFRGLPIWEGHVRDELEALVKRIAGAGGDRKVVAAALAAFLAKVCTGFRPSMHGALLLREIADECRTGRRGIPEKIQQLARCIVDSPDHRGAARALMKLEGLRLPRVTVDLRREFWDACKLADFEDPQTGLSELARFRSHVRKARPTRSISTIHKAKGLECDAVMLAPCDAATWPDREQERRLLYVALSRAKRALLLVVPDDNPSPLFHVA